MRTRCAFGFKDKPAAAARVFLVAIRIPSKTTTDDDVNVTRSCTQPTKSYRSIVKQQFLYITHIRREIFIFNFLFELGKALAMCFSYIYVTDSRWDIAWRLNVYCAVYKRAANIW